MGTTGVAIRMVISLAVVLCLLFAVARFTRKGRPTSGGPDLTVISRVTVGSKASVAVVRLGERALVVGVTEQSVTLLSETPVADLVEPEPAVEADTPVVIATPPSPMFEKAGDVVVRRKVVAAPSPRPAAKDGKLTGSALAPDTWHRTMDAVRDLTVRR